MNKDIKMIMAAVACIALCGVACAKPGPGNDRRGDSGRGNGRGGAPSTQQQRQEPTGGYRSERDQQRGGYRTERGQQRGGYSHYAGEYGHRDGAHGRHGSERHGGWFRPTPPTPPSPPPPPPPPPRRF